MEHITLYYGGDAGDAEIKHKFKRPTMAVAVELAKLDEEYAMALSALEKEQKQLNEIVEDEHVGGELDDMVLRLQYRHKISAIVWAYYVEALKAILIKPADPSHVEQYSTGPTSPFWLNQNVEAVQDAVDSFRQSIVLTRGTRRSAARAEGVQDQAGQA